MHHSELCFLFNDQKKYQKGYCFHWKTRTKIEDTKKSATPSPLTNPVKYTSSVKNCYHKTKNAIMSIAIIKNIKLNSFRSNNTVSAKKIINDDISFSNHFPKLLPAIPNDDSKNISQVKINKNRLLSIIFFVLGLIAFIALIIIVFSGFFSIVSLLDFSLIIGLIISLSLSIVFGFKSLSFKRNFISTIIIILGIAILLFCLIILGAIIVNL